jgi:MFS family permease
MIQSHGYTALQAGVIASVPSWIMVFASIGAGQIVDRTGRSDLVLYTGMFAATVSLLLLTQSMALWPAVILFGLVGAAPAGVIMALTGEAMPAHARAFGMGLFFSDYFVLVTPAPAIAGWFFDVTNKPDAAIVFGASLFALAAVCNRIFRWRQRVAPAAAI